MKMQMRIGNGHGDVWRLVAGIGAQRRRPVWDGIYTLDQAKRGEALL